MYAESYQESPRCGVRPRQSVCCTPIVQFLTRRLGVGVVGIGFIGFVVANHAARRRAQLSVARHAASPAADYGSFDASLGVGAGD